MGERKRLAVQMNRTTDIYRSFFSLAAKRQRETPSLRPKQPNLRQVHLLRGQFFYSYDGTLRINAGAEANVRLSQDDYNVSRGAGVRTRGATA